jgi:hypothetical protein
MSEQDQLVLFKNLIFEMAIRVATLEKILLDKNIFSLEDISKTEESLTKEATDFLHEAKQNNSNM